ncbi:MAG TPA: ribonuclease BN [candidate division Zixibacteria bacterium]|nr:ribonuclease BN [candidate division Zixibacteria bacterium]HBZ02064.1 ribonuclease BN [candidate division Zixibacteria bacterium]
MRKLKAFLKLFWDAYIYWDNDKAWRMGAALAYFTIFSLAPLLLIIIVIAGAVYGRAAAQGQIVSQIQDLIGQAGATAIQDMISNVSQSHATTWATLFGVGMLIMGASGVFVQLRDSLDTVFQVTERPLSTVKAYLLDRIISLGMILTIGFVLLGSLILSTAVSGFGGYISTHVPGLENILRIIELAVSFFIIWVLFALMFKFLPAIRIRWRPVLVGAAVSSFLFTIGKYFIGLYLGKSGASSLFGAAGSLAVILLWSFYSSLIFLYGAEFTKCYAQRFGPKP